MTREKAIRWMTVLKQSKINWIGDTNKIAGIKAECEKAEQEAFDMAIEALSTKSDRPTGRWIFEPKDAIELMFTKPKCSECGFESADGGNYCPNCGARMYKGGDGE